MMESTAGSFWDAERKWQETEVTTPFDVELTDHRSEGGRFKSFVTYNVTSTLCSTGVRRRYSDFEWLREVLKLRFHGIAIPMLPEKRVIGNQGIEFIEERQRGLTSFLRQVAGNPYLRHDHTYRMFLTVKDSGAGEWDQAKKAAATGEGAHPASNVGLNRWFGVLRMYTIPADADDACAALTVHLGEMEKGVADLLGAVTKYFDAAKKLATCLTDVHTAMEAVETTSMMGSGSLPPSVASAREEVGAMATVSSKMGTALNELQDLAGFAPSEIQVFLMDALIKELLRIRGMKELLGIRESALKDYQNAWQRREKLEAEKKGFAEKGRVDKADKLDPQIASASDVVKQCHERLDDITKGIINVEAHKISKVRVEKFTHIFGQYAALGIVSGAKTQQTWTTFLSSMTLDEHTMVTAAQKTLTSTSADDNTVVTILVGPGTGAAPSSVVASTPDAPSFSGTAAGAGAGAGGAPAFDDQEIDL